MNSPLVQTSSLIACLPTLSTRHTSLGIRCWYVGDGDDSSTSDCGRPLNDNVGSWTPPNVAVKFPPWLVCVNKRVSPATQCGRIGPVSSTLLTCPPDDCWSMLPCLTLTRQHITRWMFCATVHETDHGAHHMFAGVTKHAMSSPCYTGLVSSTLLTGSPLPPPPPNHWRSLLSCLALKQLNYTFLKIGWAYTDTVFVCV